MNVNDVKGDCPAVEDKLISIFEKQRSLMEKYEQIEASNGLLQTSDIPVVLDDNKGQARLKDFMWRITEEVAEAWEALLDGDVMHFKEELSDALHFLVEGMILAGLGPYDINSKVLTHVSHEGDLLDRAFGLVDKAPTLDCADVYVWNFISGLGLAANCLKNKPWKQSHMITDATKFRDLMIFAFCDFIHLCYGVGGFDSQSLYDMYFRKNEVNKFRQGSNY